jgi:hypothetical protein
MVYVPNLISSAGLTATTAIISGNTIISAVQPTLTLSASTNARSIQISPALGAIDSTNSGFHFNRFSAQAVAVGFSSASNFRVGQALESGGFGTTALIYIGNTINTTPAFVIIRATGQTSNIMQVRSTTGSTADIFTIYSSNNVGIGSGSDSGYKLGVIGTFGVAPTATTSGSVSLAIFSGASHTNQTASELIDVNFLLRRIVQFSATTATTINLQRTVNIEGATYSSISANTILSAYTFYVNGAPLSGTNTTINSPFALGVSGNSNFIGNVGIGNISPTEKLTVAGRLRTTNSDMVVESNARGFIVKDTTDGNYYRIQTTNGVVTATSVGTTLPTE